MARSEEDEAWRAIVENYGERAELEPDEGTSTPEGDQASARSGRLPDPSLFGITEVPAELVAGESDDGFVPPPTPPLPTPSRDRLIAWMGLFGSPTLLLIALVIGIRIPDLIAYLLIAWFIGGFGYLVYRMPSGPADPWDDGARL